MGPCEAIAETAAKEVESLRQQLASVTKERDELVAALKKAIDYVPAGYGIERQCWVALAKVGRAGTTTETEMHTNSPEGISRNHLLELGKKCGLIGNYRTVEMLDAIEGYARVVLADKAVQEAFVAANPQTILSMIALIEMQHEVLKKVNTAYDRVSDGLQSDLENGVKWLNKQAAQKFNKEYPGVVKALDALLDASVSTDDALAAYKQFNSGETK